jgi:adenosine deaminase
MNKSVQLSLFNRKLGNSNISNAILNAPKIDLHRHLLGSLSIDSFIKISNKYNIPLPKNNEDELMNLLKIYKPVNGLKEFFKPWKYFSRLIISPEVVYDITYEVLRDLAKDNVCYSEIRTSWGMTGNENFSVHDFVYSLFKASVDAKRDFDIHSRFLLGITRHIMGNHQQWKRKKLYEQILKAAIGYKNKCVVGFDLSGVETGYPPKIFNGFFKKVHEMGFRSSIHCGETTGPENIWESLNNICPHRISHGLSAVQDKSLLEYLRENEISVEICPTSNLLTKRIESIKLHPIRQLYDNGIKVTINTDNPEICNTTLSKEIHLLIKNNIFSLSEIKNLLNNSLEVSFAPMEIKMKLKKQLAWGLYE